VIAVGADGTTIIAGRSCDGISSGPKRSALLASPKGRITAATIADHIDHHEGDWNKFVLGRLQSLCEPCHREKHRVLRYGPKLTFGPDGWPVEPSDPADL
jgi:hypothetical protein